MEAGDGGFRYGESDRDSLSMSHLKRAPTSADKKRWELLFYMWFFFRLNLNLTLQLSDRSIGVKCTGFLS